MVMMRNRATKSERWTAAAFALSLALPSTAVAQTYLDVTGVVAYLVLAGVALFWIHARLPLIARALTTKRAYVVAAVILGALVVLFAVGYPLANSGRFGRGSDRDEAMNLAATELLHGRYPYYPRTYTGNQISPLPGAVVLAVPAMLLGNTAYQNLFWLGAFVAGAAWLFNDLSAAVVLMAAILAASPTVL